MKNVKFINVTSGHDVVLFLVNGEKLVIKWSGITARCEELPSEEGTIVLFEGKPITIRKQRFGPVIDLPEPQEGVIYIASGMVKERAGRSDVVAPDTSLGAVKDPTTQRIVGVLGLVA